MVESARGTSERSIHHCVQRMQGHERSLPGIWIDGSSVLNTPAKAPSFYTTGQMLRGLMGNGQWATHASSLNGGAFGRRFLPGRSVEFSTPARLRPFLSLHPSPSDTTTTRQTGMAAPSSAAGVVPIIDLTPLREGGEAGKAAVAAAIKR